MAGAAGAPRVTRTGHPIVADESRRISVVRGDHVRVESGYAWRSTSGRPTRWAGGFDIELTGGAGPGGRPHYVRANSRHPAGWVMSGILLNQNGTRKKNEPSRLFIVSDLGGVSKLEPAPWQERAAAEAERLRSAPLPKQRKGPLKLTAAVRRKLDELAAGLPTDTDGWRATVAELDPPRLEIEREIEYLERDIKVRQGEKARFDLRTEENIRHSHIDIRAFAFGDPDNYRAQRAAQWGQTSDGIALADAEKRLKLRRKQLAAGPTSSTQHLFREAQRQVSHWKFDEDVDGVRTPSKELDQHLDAVLAAGKLLDQQLLKALRADPMWVSMERRLVDGDLSQAVISQLWNEGRHSDYSTRATDRQAMIRLQAERRREILHELLAAVRPHGTVHHADLAASTDADRAGYVPSRSKTDYPEEPAHPDYEAHIHAAERYYPDDWIQLSSDRGRLRIASRQRAHYRSGDGVLATGDYDSTQWSRNGFPTSYEETNVHELAHRMEVTVPGLRHLQFAMVRRRATRRGRVDRAKKLATIYPNSSYGTDEWTYEDQWADAYTGKTYETLGDRGRPVDSDPTRHHWELFSTGVEDLFSGVPRFDRRPEPKLVRGVLTEQGSELEQFTLGVLALLARRRRT
jgi:hypothetical protein